MDPDKVSVVTNGPILSDFQEIRTSAQKNSKVIKVGYVGNINPQDGLDVLIRAANYICIKMNRKDIEFVCIGDGSAYRNIRRFASEFEVDNVVKFTGRMPPREAWQILANCDICVQPDPKLEGQGNQ